MKKTLLAVLVLIASVFVLSSCGDVDAYDFDVFGLYTPFPMKQDPEKLYEEAAEDVLRLDEYDITIDYTVKASGEKLRGSTKSRYEEQSSEIHIVKTEDAFSYELAPKKAEIAQNERQSQTVICVDGIIYTKIDRETTKQPVTDAEYYERLASFEQVLSVIILNFDDDNYEDAEVVEDGDLFKLELSIEKDDYVVGYDEFVEGKLSAWFDEDGRLKEYMVSVTFEIESDGEDGTYRLEEIYEIEIDDVKMPIAPPKGLQS